MNTQMIHFAVIGAGRIGQVHLQALTENPHARIIALHDPHHADIDSMAHQFHTQVAHSAEEIFNNTNIDAILIASATDTHYDYLYQGMHHQKFIFCEKPIDLNITKIRQLDSTAKEYDKLIGIGFNRRHDPHFANLKNKIDHGDIGKIENITITSRDPEPPPVEYIKVSGGLPRDMMIHDLDMLHFLLGTRQQQDTLEQVHAMGSNRVSDEIAAAGDLDTVSAHFKTSTGTLCQIINSRRAVYGYDQRIEVFGEKGMLQVDNPRQHQVNLFIKDRSQQTLPHHFFLTRYAEAYRRQINTFIHAIIHNQSFNADFTDGLNASEAAEAVAQSLTTAQMVKL